jgi:phosphoglycerol transferase MdoB-like AlkP superfamily enzyme
MLVRLKFFFLHSIYWILLFIIARLFFLLYYFDLSVEIGIKEVLLTFIHGLKLDISFTGYLMFFVCYFLAFLFWLDIKKVVKVINIYTYFFSVIVIIAIVGDLLLYKHWGFRLDSTPILYLKSPKDAAASVDFTIFLQFVFFIALFLFTAFYLHKYIVVKQDYTERKRNILILPLFVFLSLTLAIPIRGGVGIAPINPGTVYFSKKPFANHAALNVPWNAGYSLTHISEDDEISYFEGEKAETIFNKMQEQSDSMFDVLKTNKPNIVIVIWESLSAKIVGPLGGMDSITPNFNDLMSEGISFHNFYANGDRSDKGIVSILSGYPAQPTQSIIKFANKTQSLSFLSKDLKKLNYTSSFYYGGDIDFANMRSYFLNGEYDEIYEVDDFSEDQRNSKWGVHDHVVFERLLNDIRKDTSNFLKVIFTLSSHEPFDVPMETVIVGNDDETRFLNSMVYTDRSLNTFINEFKKLPVWDSTLLIILADHGARHPGNSPNYPPEKFHIPMVWTGGALKVKATAITNYCSQVDIVATLFAQMDIDYNEYSFSNNIFSNRKTQFAFYAFNNGFGYFTNNDSIVYDNVSKKHILNSSESLQASTDKGKAYLQVLMNDFNSR